MRREECGERRASVLRRTFYFFTDIVDYVRFIRLQDRIVVLDERDCVWVKEYFGKQAVVIRNGTNAEAFPYQKRVVISDPIRLCMIGIFFPHRRFEDAIQALSFLSKRGLDATLTIVGQYRSDDPYAQKIQRLIEELHLQEKVTLLGRISDERLAEIYRVSDIFLFPNHLQSWGLAVFEALASGLPAIVSSTAGASEVLIDKETALIVPPKSPEMLAECVATLVRDPLLYKRLSEQGRSLVVQELTWKNTALKMEGLFRTLCKK